MSLYLSRTEAIYLIANDYPHFFSQHVHLAGRAKKRVQRLHFKSVIGICQLRHECGGKQVQSGAAPFVKPLSSLPGSSLRDLRQKHLNLL
jgi:hypothetical protein